MTIEEQIADLEAKLAELKKAQEPDCEALSPAIDAYIKACDKSADNYRIKVARGITAAYPLLKAYHEAREKPVAGEWIDAEGRLWRPNEDPPFIPWGPNSAGYPKCPVPDGTDCEVQTRCGAVLRHHTPEAWGWHHLQTGRDIIAYRTFPAGDA